MKQHPYFWLFAILFSCVLLLMAPGCAPDAQTGQAFVGVSTQALSSQDVTRVKITVSGPSVPPNFTQDLVKAGGQWQGIIGQIPAGSGRTFTAEAFGSSGALLYQGAATGVTITPTGPPAAVTIVLQQHTPPTPFQNATPTIQFLTASKAAAANDESIQLIAGASDVDGDPLSYNWSSAQGTFPSGSTGTNVTWKAPSAPFAGPVTISLRVSDGRGGNTGTSLTIQVSQGTGQAQLNVSFNTWPLVTQMNSSNDPVNTGQNTNLAVVANDPDGDPVSYAWTALGNDCQAGSFSNATAATPTWTAPTTLPNGGICVLQVTVNDNNGGQTTGTLTLNVGPPAPPNFPPQIVNSFQSSATANIGTTVTFRVNAVDPEGTAITFTWSDSNGGVGTGITNTGSGPYQSELVWTQPAGPCPQTITVNATDATGQTTSHTFQINQGVSTCGTPPGPHTTQLALGMTHTCALQSDGTVKCAGADGLGQLGNGSAPPHVQSPTPITVPGLSGISQLTSLFDFSCALNTSNSVQCWGNNAQNQLGTASPMTYTSPTAIAGLANISQISANISHSCAVDTGGQVSCWGNNASGKFALNNSATYLPPTTIPGLTNVDQVAAGGFYSCVLLTSGSVQCWGFNTKGQLGDGTNTNSASPVTVTGIGSASQIAVGVNHACAIVSGQVWCWGDNQSGQLGDGTNVDRWAPVQAIGITNATKIQTGGEYTCALLAGGGVKCWGLNHRGQLGIGNTTNQNTPTTVPGLNNPTDIAVGLSHTCALQTLNTVRCWGFNSHGQLADGTTTNQASPTVSQF